jgi:hypothetical protein
VPPQSLLHTTPCACSEAQVNTKTHMRCLPVAVRTLSCQGGCRLTQGVQILLWLEPRTLQPSPERALQFRSLHLPMKKPSAALAPAAAAAVATEVPPMADPLPAANNLLCLILPVYCNTLQLD